jgi:hypothetical protein
MFEIDETMCQMAYRPEYLKLLGEDEKSRTLCDCNCDSCPLHLNLKTLVEEDASCGFRVSRKTT